ncbi:MAG: hypothetical protein MO846_02880 [Candidatus Devosia symbiotica]|nr:hypothetical protein [Candidatus Devosia symbiotica]
MFLWARPGSTRYRAGQQKGITDIVEQARSMGEGDDGQEMGDKHHRAGGKARRLIDGFDPVVEIGLIPICLFDNGGRAHALGPAQLLVAWLGIV